MKKRIIIFLSSIFFILCFIYYPTTVKPILTSSTDLSSININGIKLNQKFRATSEYKTTKNINYIPRNHHSYITYDYHGIGALLVTVIDHNSNIIELLPNSAYCNLNSSKGITMYESLNNIKQIFGNHYYRVTTERYGDTITFIDKKNKLKLVFGLTENKKVSAIIFFNYKNYDYPF